MNSGLSTPVLAVFISVSSRYIWNFFFLIARCDAHSWSILACVVAIEDCILWEASSIIPWSQRMLGMTCNWEIRRPDWKSFGPILSDCCYWGLLCDWKRNKAGSHAVTLTCVGQDSKCHCYTLCPSVFCLSSFNLSIVLSWCLCISTRINSGFFHNSQLHGAKAAVCF